MEECLFCKIVEGKISAYKIYEDANYLAFLDIFPRVKGHALIIPKKHFRWVYDVPSFGEYWEAARRVALSIQEVTQSRFTSFVTLGEEVPHAHIHIMPYIEKKPAGITFSPVITISKEELLKLTENIKKGMGQ